MKHKILAAVGGVVLVSLAAVGAFASQDAVSFTEDETPTVTETVEATETPTETPESTQTAEPTATEEASETPEAEDTNDGDDEERDIRGIPDSNPVKSHENGDGVCDKHETVIKTTPSGVQVNVPCNAVHDDKDEDDEDEAEEADDEDDEDDDDDEDEDDEDDQDDSDE